ncbi:MAG: OmpA family protein [Candidatus Binatia bacterium]
MERLLYWRKVLSLGSSVFLLSFLPGCLATRGWVQEQLNPLDARLSGVEGRMGEAEGRLSSVEAKADQALANFDHLRLERRFVLSLKDGATFSFDSDALSSDARQQIDGFLSDLENTQDVIFLVAGHTDDTGSDRYNYELGQRRAAGVARYLTSRKGIDPLHVSTMSYGSSTPIARNSTAEGRQKNRRIEILVYKEAITTSAAPPSHAATY